MIYSFILLYLLYFLFSPEQGKLELLQTRGRKTGSEGGSWNGSGMFSLGVVLGSEKLKTYCLRFLLSAPVALHTLGTSSALHYFP